MPHLYPLLLLALVALGCDRPDERPRDEAPPAAVQPAEERAETSAVVPAARSSEAPVVSTSRLPTLAEESARCQQRIDAALATPSLPGAPRLEKQRALVMARGKAEPVLFVQEPEFQGKKTPGIEAHRKNLLTTSTPRELNLKLARHFRGAVPLGRDVFLRHGYFYTDDPGAARVLTVLITLEHLFLEKELWLERGSERFIVKRNAEGRYIYATGPEKGLPAQLLLFDRVGPKGADYGPPLHVDVRELANRLGFLEMRVRHLGEEHIVADLRYGEEWVPAFLERSGAELELGCHVIDPDRAAAQGRARDEAYRRAAVLRALRQAILTQVNAQLPFDEPRTEFGQQDGELRRHWRRAYLSGKTTYEFNGDEYRVFDRQGVPMVPQVCIDFITESFERATGMHWTHRGEPPEHVLGGLDFTELLGSERRRETGFRDYAERHPEHFAPLNFPRRDWVPYEKEWAFFRFIRDHRDELRTGDVVVIKGKTPWDKILDHTHTFFIYESDPVTGMPILLAGNSGRPRLIGWDAEMMRAPKRSIRHRMRPNTEWLYDLVVHQSPESGERWAPPLAVRFPG
ncbi:MAG: hypothetical protein GX607_17565 [Myxococcales bacterium]|nr:hypothetical protein [Myxococcales bacterium]